ncbi:hypothetical protein BGI41_06520 [Methanobrevibacter sp. 87.7]|uniref:HAD family hydrolase n=1 Tax=Methanobrevibacter sp. 87.7 TaxID=387957 RepID=UPI000B50119E|nr:HAD family hydrolase [Methanobrevibacter sp. 87.7]OWT32662.1 hypothetical protein BGI41_06520 [Methanobrevibacter sp. 87.7]
MRKLFIFDFDGTLVNTFEDSLIAYNKALEKHNLPIFQYENIEDVNFNDFISQMGSDEKVLETYEKIYKNSLNIHTKPYPGISELLSKLNDSDCEIAICSNRIQDLLRSLTSKFFPNIDFKFVIGHILGGPFKPDPSVLGKILDNVSYDKKDIIYVGDRLTDIRTAKNSGIDVAIVTWGQGEKEDYNNDYVLKVINSPDDLLDL